MITKESYDKFSMVTLLLTGMISVKHYKQTETVNKGKLTPHIWLWVQALTPCLALSSLYCVATSLKRTPAFSFSIASMHFPCFSHRICRTCRKKKKPRWFCLTCGREMMSHSCLIYDSSCPIALSLFYFSFHNVLNVLQFAVVCSLAFSYKPFPWKHIV